MSIFIQSFSFSVCRARIFALFHIGPRHPSVRRRRLHLLLLWLQLRLYAHRSGNRRPLSSFTEFYRVLPSFERWTRRCTSTRTWRRWPARRSWPRAVRSPITTVTSPVGSLFQPVFFQVDLIRFSSETKDVDGNRNSWPEGFFFATLEPLRNGAGARARCAKKTGIFLRKTQTSSQTGGVAF